MLTTTAAAGKSLAPAPGLGLGLGRLPSSSSSSSPALARQPRGNTLVEAEGQAPAVLGVVSLLLPPPLQPPQGAQA